MVQTELDSPQTPYLAKQTSILLNIGILLHNHEFELKESLKVLSIVHCSPPLKPNIDITKRILYFISWNNAMKKLVEINEPDSILNTFILFIQTARVATKYQDSYMTKHAGISDVKLIVLMAFFYNPAIAITVSQIAQWTDTAPHNVTTLIARMKQEGLLETKRDEKDKRVVKVKITDKGLSVLKNSMAPAQHVVDQLMSSVTQDDAHSLAKVLNIIRQNAYNGLESLTDS